MKFLIDNNYHLQYASSNGSYLFLTRFLCILNPCIEPGIGKRQVLLPLTGKTGFAGKRKGKMYSRCLFVPDFVR